MKIIEEGGEEIWKPIPDFPGYEASSLGRIRSFRGFNGKIADKPHFIKPQKHRLGYLQITLSIANKRITKTVHSLVLKSFIDKPSAKHQACHLNGDRGDSRLENLIWGTVKENSSHRFDHGTMIMGEEVHTSILNDEKVISICEEIKKGESLKVLAIKYGVHRKTINCIKLKRTWKHITRGTI